MIVLVLALVLTQSCAVNISKICGPSAFFEQEGDLNVGFVVNDCDSGETLLTSLASAAVWTVQRLNFLEYTSPVKLGVGVYKVCTRFEYFDAVFQLYRANDQERLLGLFTNKQFDGVTGFHSTLGINEKVTPKYLEFLLKGSVKLLDALDWKENITVVAPNRAILREFYKFTRREWLCVKQEVVFNSLSAPITVITFGPTIVFGDQKSIKFYLNHFAHNPEEDIQVIFVPLDGSQINELPEFSYVIQPPHVVHNIDYDTPVNIINSPLILEVAGPIISYAQNISTLIANICNDTVHNASCLAKHLAQYPSNEFLFNPLHLIEILKIEHLKSKFIYNVFRIENLSVSDNPTPVQTFVKVFTYSIFDEVLTNYETNRSSQGTNYTISGTFCPRPFDECLVECINFESNAFKSDPILNLNIWLRSEPWVFGCLALALLGVLFCVAIFMFLMTRICKRDVLEGNPLLTILLLLVTTFVFLSVFFLAIEGDETTSESVCLSRTLSITLCYASVFSLLLGRIILLGNASKEIGFMSHVAGPVQSFLTIFIFSVQCALDIQLLNDCQNILISNNFLYILSYNVILLVLLICLCPLIVRSQRNYREGKHFVMAISLMACTWSCWVPVYVLIGLEWKDFVLGFGLISTGGVLLATIFIPRTYLMAIAEARDQLTSALPSLATAASTLDMYRTGTQAIYDCVNIAAISNSSTILRANALTAPQHSLGVYSSPELPNEEELDFRMCSTPVPDDKVTRF